MHIISIYTRTIATIYFLVCRYTSISYQYFCLHTLSTKYCKNLEIVRSWKVLKYFGCSARAGIFPLVLLKKTSKRRQYRHINCCQEINRGFLAIWFCNTLLLCQLLAKYPLKGNFSMWIDDLRKCSMFSQIINSTASFEMCI